jgi:hypothetical protein
MDKNKTKTRAYFHHINRTGWSPDDPLSNWAQAEREERRQAGDALSAESYTLRFPFSLPTTHSISDIHDSKIVPSDVGKLTLKSVGGNGYVLTAEAIPTENAAKDFFYRALGALGWLALDLKLPVISPRSLGRITWADNPYEAALNLSQSFNLSVPPPLDGLASADEALIHPDWAVLRFMGVGTPSTHIATSGDNATGSLATGLSSTNPEVFCADPRLEIALDLFINHFHERSATSRLLSLVMSLEALTTGDLKHLAAVELLEKWRTELALEKEQYAEGSEELAALDSLDNELWFRKETSISSQVRSVVRRALTVAGAPDVKPMLKLTVSVYKARSKLAHDGTLPPQELSEAVAAAQHIVTRVLKARLQYVLPSA